MTIERVSNGYIFRDDLGMAEVYRTTDELFARILLALEGRAESFSGNAYGHVLIVREKVDVIL